MIFNNNHKNNRYYFISVRIGMCSRINVCVGVSIRILFFIKQLNGQCGLQNLKTKKYLKKC